MLRRGERAVDDDEQSQAIRANRQTKLFVVQGEDRLILE